MIPKFIAQVNNFILQAYTSTGIRDGPRPHGFVRSIYKYGMRRPVMKNPGTPGDMRNMPLLFDHVFENIGF
jgi:hypothetical protein